MEALRIVLLCISAAVLYGILHDQVTARVCIEYFTIGHPPIFNFDTESPTMLALGWGIIATWWVGSGLGLSAAVVARAGLGPKWTARQLRRPMMLVLIAMAGLSLMAGVCGYILAENGGIWLTEPLRSQVPAHEHSAFLADLWAHTAAYATGVCGGLIMCVRIGLQRWRNAQQL